MKKYIKQLLFLIFFSGFITGPLFGAGADNLKVPKVDKKGLKKFEKVIDMQGYYNDLSEMVPAVILLAPDSTSGITNQMTESLYNEIKLQMVLNSYFKPISMTKYLDGKYTDKKEKNLFQFFDGIKSERYQVNLKGICKSKIFKCGSEYIVYIAILPFDNQGYPITSLRIIKNENEIQSAVKNCLFDLNKLMKEHVNGKIKIAVSPFEISCRTLVEQKTGEFDFIKTSFSNQEGIELKESDDFFSYILAHQATATGLYSATPLNLIPEYVNGNITSTSITNRADYLVKTKIVLSNKNNIISMSLIRTDTGTLLKTSNYFTKNLNATEVWKFLNYFLSEITKTVYSEKNYAILNNISYSGKAFYKDGMFIGWNTIDNFPIPANKLIINTGSMLISNIAENPNIYYSNNNNDLFIYVNNNEIKTFIGREGAYVWNLLEK